ncbi:MAG: hypothetical protein HS115_14020 [Spirochaetales bacterium]|nr:hypothetical protein [Spirochaetales bacterium]
MSLLIKFVTGFAALGLIISLTFSLLGGNRITSVVVTTVVCTLLSAGMGLGTYKTLEMRVPEFLEFLAGLSSFESTETGADKNYFDSEDSESEYGDGDSAQAVSAQAEDSTETRVFGDHILVNKVKIKNEPKLIAQAIRTMLAKDNE